MENKKELEELRDAFRRDGQYKEATLIHNAIQEMEILEDELSKLKGPPKEEEKKTKE